MCECGCGEFRPIGKLPAKGGWYAIEVYPGCPDCDTSWGLGVTFLKRSHEDTKWLLKDVPDITFGGRNQWGRQILNTTALRKRFVEHAGDDPDNEANFALDEFLSRGGLRHVYYDTLAASPLKRDGNRHESIPGG